MDASKSLPPSGLPQQFHPLPASSCPFAPHAVASSHNIPERVTLCHYRNPQTLQTITTHLPPTHSAMQCLQQGAHVPDPTRWGLLDLLGLVLLPHRYGALFCGYERGARSVWGGAA
ncbi:hypothetical protein BS47DRAFT_1351820 [Hydnum rufescens UP504]|uniref:Uncharacterized protein n=1 Tax=Hydnum rufescens UP504 TaxID=1448309 RepID=A0A9P6AKK7_9AGAM|nr:hypothetical protein BS47DRAFT_1351820 [Hydnum rufescens UP504]